MSFIGAGLILTVVAVIIYGHITEKRRLAEITVQHRTPASEPKALDDEDLWQRAYRVSRSPHTYDTWKAWMIQGGYNPIYVIEQAEFQNRKR